LLSRLTEIYANRAERVMFVRGDDDLNFAYIAEVIDIGRAANVDQHRVDDAEDSGWPIARRRRDSQCRGSRWVSRYRSCGRRRQRVSGARFRLDG